MLRLVPCKLRFAASDLLEHETMAIENLLTANLALRPREAAKALGISERTLWAWTHDGDLPHVRIGRMTLYPVDALRDWLRRRVEVAQGAQHDPR